MFVKAIVFREKVQNLNEMYDRIVRAESSLSVKCLPVPGEKPVENSAYLKSV
jgi:hypothetical protein